MWKILFSAASAGLLWVGCLPCSCPSSVSGTDGGSDAPYVALPPTPSVTLACANMKTAGCPEGQASNCADVVEKMVDTNLTKVDLQCLSTSTTVDAVRKCGQRCLVR